MKKVLIVDDEPEMVELIALILAASGVDLLTAHDGQRALEIAREERPHLVITDVMMPRLDGRQLCIELKSDPETCGAHVVLMSAMRCLSADGCRADARIPKPFDIEQVQETVDRLLDGSS